MFGMGRNNEVFGNNGNRNGLMIAVIGAGAAAISYLRNRNNQNQQNRNNPFS
jgi:hypothetical protein